MNEGSKPCKHCGKTMHKQTGTRVVSNFNWARKVFCDHNCRSAFNNKTYKAKALKLLAKKQECVSCKDRKPLFEFPLRRGKRRNVCKKCTSEARKVKIQWRNEEEKEMKKIRLLRKNMAGLDISHSSMPNLLEPFIGLKVYLDQ